MVLGEVASMSDSIVDVNTKLSSMIESVPGISVSTRSDLTLSKDNFAPSSTAGGGATSVSDGTTSTTTGGSTAGDSPGRGTTGGFWWK